MHEIELKFQVPLAQQAAVRRAVATRTAQQTRLQAQYFDTADRLLAGAGFALRLRQEGDRWVQTLKGGGDGLMRRLEHNAVLPDDVVDPRLDLSRHDDTPAGKSLSDLLARQGRAAADLLLQYVTDIRRTHRCVRHEGAVVELAFDEGSISGGDGAVQLCELEFELVRGTPQALLSLARRWVHRHQLWLDVRTKAERGDRLARGLAHGAPARSASARLNPGLSPRVAAALMMRSVLQQVLPNASDLAGEVGMAEHVHQLRVGLRRLRTVLREFGEVWTPAQAGGDIPALEAPAAVPGADPVQTLALGVARLFAQLGAVRDLDALAESVLPALKAAGAPALALTLPTEAEPVGALLRAPQTQDLWLDALLLSLAGPASGDESPAPDAAGAAGEVPSEPLPITGQPKELVPWVQQRLDALHRRICKDAARFSDLPIDDQHRVRKRVKRLRYVLELASDLFAGKAAARYLDALRPAQDALGLYNDLWVAEGLYRREVGLDPRAWFAVGWLCAQRERAARRAARELRRLARAPVGWVQRRRK